MHHVVLLYTLCHYYTNYVIIIPVPNIVTNDYDLIIGSTYQEPIVCILHTCIKNFIHCLHCQYSHTCKPYISSYT